MEIKPIRTRTDHERALREMIRRLHQRFGIPVDVLIRPSLRRRAA